MKSSLRLSEEAFTQAANHWELDRLYRDLSIVKKRTLTDTEQACLRGFLCGASPTEIATALHRQVGGLRVDLTRGLYRYIEAIAGKVNHWRDIAKMLEQQGYKSNLLHFPAKTAPLIHSSCESSVELLDIAH